ncbi:MAG: hypothetical protein ABWY02_14200 [Telluria sp.]
MKSSIQRVVACVLLASALHPVSGLACAIVTKEEAARSQQAWIEQSKAEAIALRDEADLVFIGKLSQLVPSRETIDQASGKNVVLHTYQAKFDFVDNIKGEYTKGQMLEFSVNKNLIYVGCGPRPFRSSLPKANGVDEVYLVYARAGTILRTNHIPEYVQALSGYEEASHLRAVPRK